MSTALRETTVPTHLSIPSPSAEYVMNLVVNDVRDPGPVGAVIWGLGVAEVRTARRLAARGIASVQVRLEQALFADEARRIHAYIRDGVSNCQAAMDAFSSQSGIGSFILMGNCAGASFCFNAALADTRVMGLILTNPYITKQELLRTSLLHKMMKPATWKRLATGGNSIGRNVKALRDLIGRSARRIPSDGTAKREKSDLDLPEDLGGAMRALCGRGVQVMIACAEGDDSTHYFRTKYESVIEELEAGGRLRFVVVATHTHVFSTDDAAAALLIDSISNWIDTTSFNAS